ncbi:MAG: hypothetical protein IIC75_02180 [Bacteroidetes bacterium]|nr:hypothetical protein [Bacteroidota bacterium]
MTKFYMIIILLILLLVNSNSFSQSNCAGNTIGSASLINGPDSANTDADQVFRSITVDPNNPSRIIVGTEGNGLFLRTTD